MRHNETGWPVRFSYPAARLSSDGVQIGRKTFASLAIWRIRRLNRWPRLAIGVTLSFLLFWLLEKDDFPFPRNTGVLLSSVAAVVLVTVGLLVAGWLVYPQFDLPKAQAEVVLDSAERGEDLFRNLSPSPSVQCQVVEGIEAEPEVTTLPVWPPAPGSRCLAWRPRST